VAKYLAFNIINELKKAVQYHQSGELEKSEKIYKKILKINPNHSDSLWLLGLIAHQVGKSDKAINLINKAIQNNPKNPIYHNDLGIVFQCQGKLNDATSCFQKALQLKSDFVLAYNNLGNVFKEQGRLSEAISCYQKALQLKPDLAEPYFNIGNAFKEQGKVNEAISYFQKAVKLMPGFAGAYNNMGNAFKEQGRLSEAISCYQKALQLKPDHANAYNNLGNVFKDLKKSDEAIACYKKALDINPNFAEAYSQLTNQLQQTCAWQELEGLSAKLDGLTKKSLDSGTKPGESPFISLSRHTDPALNFAIARSWSCDIARSMSNLKIHFTFDERKLFKRKIAVGYLSNDFCNHPVAHLMLSLFGLHNRDEFEIFCYSYGEDDGSYYRERIKRDCDKFIDIRDLNYIDAAKCIYKDQIDILVDLTGHTSNNRLSICALRPAPIQVSYLGFPGTTGADFFDYTITDRIVTPEDHAPYYSENFVYMPHCYQVNDHTQVISNRDWKEMDFGLPEDTFVFCSFNQPYKIERIIFNVWINILLQVPESVLWLSLENKTAETNLRHESEARDLKSERLIFSNRLPPDEHLKRLKLADMALDTRIYNGGATTSNALWAGVPVLTLQGNHFASRMSASILTSIGLTEMITYSLEEYETLAVRLAHHPDEFQTIRQKLAQNRLTAPLFDTPRFARNLETAYTEMWKIFLAGERPRQIEVLEI